MNRRVSRVVSFSLLGCYKCTSQSRITSECTTQHVPPAWLAVACCRCDRAAADCSCVRCAPILPVRAALDCWHLRATRGPTTWPRATLCLRGAFCCSAPICGPVAAVHRRTLRGTAVLVDVWRRINWGILRALAVVLGCCRSC